MVKISASSAWPIENVKIARKSKYARPKNMMIFFQLPANLITNSISRYDDKTFTFISFVISKHWLITIYSIKYSKMTGRIFYLLWMLRFVNNGAQLSRLIYYRYKKWTSLIHLMCRCTKQAYTLYLKPEGKLFNFTRADICQNLNSLRSIGIISYECKLYSQPAMYKLRLISDKTLNAAQRSREYHFKVI